MEQAEIVTFPGVAARCNPRADVIDADAVEWSVRQGLTEDGGRIAASRLGAVTAYLYPDAPPGKDLLWGRWYVWWFLVDDRQGRVDSSWMAWFRARAEDVLYRGGDGPRFGEPYLDSLAELCRAARRDAGGVYPHLVRGTVEALNAMTLEVANKTAGRMPAGDPLDPLDEYLYTHQASFGKVFDFTVYEDCRGGVVPDSVRYTPQWSDLTEASICVAILGNDMHGAQRDAVDGHLYNAVLLLEKSGGLSRDEAMEAVRHRAREFVRQGRSARARLPVLCRRLGLDEATSTFVQQVAADTERYVLGSALWYPTTTRYDR